ncbi:hypothetical protein STRTUCAR8_05852, partial [Streptomyces turgidiscabies Car8]
MATQGDGSFRPRAHTRRGPLGNQETGNTFTARDRARVV